MLSDPNSPYLTVEEVTKLLTGATTFGARHLDPQYMPAIWQSLPMIILGNTIHYHEDDVYHLLCVLQFIPDAAMIPYSGTKSSGSM